MAPQMHKPENKNCVYENMKPTSVANAFALVCIIAGLFTWFIRNIICLQESKTDHAFMVNGSVFIITNVDNQTIFSLPIIFHQRNIEVILWLVLSGPIYFILLVKTLGSSIMSRFWTIVGITVCALMIARPIWQMSYTTMDLCAMLYYGVALLAYFVADPYRLAEIIKKISAAAFSFPIMHLFGFTAASLCFSIFVFTLTCFYSMENIISSIFCLIGGIYLILLVFLFATLVIAESISTWFSSANKKELSGFTVLKSFHYVARNYGETLMINCTVILPVIASIYTCCSEILSPTYKNDYNSSFMKLLIRVRAIEIAFWGVFSAIFMTFIEISKITSLGGVIIIFSNNTRYNKDLMNKEDIYHGLGIFMFAVAYTTVVVGISVLLLTKKEKRKTTVQKMTQNQNKTQEQCEKSHIQLIP